MKNKNVSIWDSNISFELLNEKLDSKKPFYKEISNANILLLPFEAFKGYDAPVFAEDTEEFYIYAKKVCRQDNLNIELFMQEDKYEELELHADVLNLPMLFFQYAFAPFVIGMVANYVYDKIKNRNKEIDIKINTIIEKDKKTKMISYSGSVDDWKQLMENLPDNFWDDDNK